MPEGNGVVIEGELVSTKWADGFAGEVEKMLVKVSTPEGEYRVWGSMPSAFKGEWGCTGCQSIGPVCKDGCDSQNHGLGYIGRAQPGDTVRFTANIERSNKDQDFGFFKRPRKASVVKGGDAK